MGPYLRYSWEKGHCIQDLEIVLDSSAFADNSKILKDAQKKNPDVIVTTQTAPQRVIIVVGPNEGVTTVFIAAGTPGYPDKLIPPLGSPYYTRSHSNEKPNYKYFPFHYAPEGLPILQSRLVLLQRVCSLNLRDSGQWSDTEHSRYFKDVRFLLIFTRDDGEEPFPNEVVTRTKFRRYVKQWVWYSRSKGWGQKSEEKKELSRLLQISEAELLL
jgi:hypothetical protein